MTRTRWLAALAALTVVCCLTLVGSSTTPSGGKRSRSAVVTVHPGDDLDAALALGKTLYLTAGTYSHADGRLVIPDGARLYGEGAGKTVVLAALTIGSNCTIGGATEGWGLTFGKAVNGGPHRFATGAHDTYIGSCRFRSPGSYSVFDLCDYTDDWGSPAGRSRCDVRDVTWQSCEFEYSAPANPMADEQALFNIWWDARATGSRVSGLQWHDCTFGARNAAGSFGPYRCGILIQPSPWLEDDAMTPAIAAQVDHGAGLAAGNATRRFVLDGCYFVGATRSAGGLADFDLCDYMRAWQWMTYGWTTASNGTPEQQASVPTRFCNEGWTISETFFGDSFIREIGRDLVIVDSPAKQGPTLYRVPDEVLAHDHELYGL